MGIGAISFGRCFETVRWQDKFSVIFDLYKRGNSEVIQKHNKKMLKPFCVLNSRGLELEMPNSRVSAPQTASTTGTHWAVEEYFNND